MKKLIFIILMVLTTFLLATPALGYEPMVPIPGAGEITDISDYIKALYLFGLAIVGVIAMLFIIIGGIRYMTAAGNEAEISEAKGQITSAILGLVLVLTSWLILHTINPELVSLKKLTVTEIELPESNTHLACGEGYACKRFPNEQENQGDEDNCTSVGESCIYYKCNQTTGICEKIMGKAGASDCAEAGRPCSTYLYCDPTDGICKRVAGAESDKCSKENESCRGVYLCWTKRYGGEYSGGCKTLEACRKSCFDPGADFGGEEGKHWECRDRSAHECKGYVE